MRFATPPALRAALVVPGLFLLALLLSAAPAVAQTTLNPGDLVVTGLVADGNESFALLATVDIETGTVFTITDKGVNAAGEIQPNRESYREFTTTAPISAGDVFIASEDATPFYPDALGTPTRGSSFISFSTSGDQVLIFQGEETSPSFVFLYSSTPFDQSWVNTLDDPNNPDPGNDPVDQSGTALPPGLVNGVSAIDFDPHVDNAEYDRTNGTSGARAQVLALVANDANYTVSNDRFDLQGGAFTVTADMIELPVTFEENIDYGIVGFAGAERSEIVTDPTDASNRVVRVIRDANAATFAGTVVANDGLAEPIPFATGATTMSVRVWAPVAGTPVRFKVENASGGKTVESQSVNTTVGGMFETLVFDLANEATGDPLDFSATYDKLVIFFDFGTSGAAEATYYFDDITFGGGGGMGNAEDVVINEIDADSPGNDVAEFVELYNTGTTPADLSGHALVFFNGSDDLSYEPAFDLDGVTIAAGEYYVICGDAANVANCDMEVATGTNNLIQNGADAVALVIGNATDFPNDTAIPTSGVIDAIVYGTGDPDATGLLTGFGETVQYDEDLNGNKENESVQRSPDGAEAFITAVATPGAANATVAPEEFTTIALGANEVPAVVTDAAGSITAVLTGTELVVTGRFDDLGSAYAASHIHEGAVGANGGVVQGLDPTVDADMLGGTFEASKNTFTLTEAQATSLRDGLFYVNIHTADNGGGEIRGQLLEETPATALTLGQARIVGTGYTVTVTGVASRAMGAFTYIQADGAGLTVRQTSGDFFDAVGDGTIQSGTEVTVTGTLSEFNNLLQINGGDLDSYTVGDTGDAPEAVVVTLAELATNGEDYEGQLVVVEDARFADTGTFALNNNYDVSDNSSSDNAVSVRVGSGADDSDVADTAIPEGPTNIAGVVTQFRDSYQILLIRASDLTMGTAGETGPASEGFELTLSNPVHAGAAVTLTAPGASDVTLELFDTIGRRVATLVDGTVTGEQTVRLSDALAPGVYVLRLTTESGRLARTLTVVR